MTCAKICCDLMASDGTFKAALNISFRAGNAIPHDTTAATAARQYWLHCCPGRGPMLVPQFQLDCTWTLILFWRLNLHLETVAFTPTPSVLWDAPGILCNTYASPSPISIDVDGITARRSFYRIWITSKHLYWNGTQYNTVVIDLYRGMFRIYRQTSNICHTLVGNTFVDHSDVVEASPVGAAPTTSSFWT